MQIELRKLTKDDALLFYKWWNDPELRMLTSGGYKKMKTDEIDRIISKHFVDPSYFDFIITVNNRPIGHILIKKPEDSKFYTFYIAIGEKDYWKRGVGTEATKQICSWFWQEFPKENILKLEVNKDNARAIRCYEKSGFLRVSGRECSKSGDTVVMQIKRLD